MKFFSKLNHFIVVYFDPIIIFFDNKNKYFRGDLRDISAKTASLNLTDILAITYFAGCRELCLQSSGTISSWCRTTHTLQNTTTSTLFQWKSYPSARTTSSAYHPRWPITMASSVPSSSASRSESTSFPIRVLMTLLACEFVCGQIPLPYPPTIRSHSVPECADYLVQQGYMGPEHLNQNRS